MPYRTPPSGKLYRCAWCGLRKPIEAMRYEGSANGKPPSTCAGCRAVHPSESWCDEHAAPHPIDQFTPYTKGRPGVWPVCRRGVELRKSRRRDCPARRCDACGETRDSWFFRGGGSKSPVCRVCEEGNPNARWCVGCRRWLDQSDFHRTGRDGKFWTVRCKPCRVAHTHGTTVREILLMQGSEKPECAACGSTTWLTVDHDHRCCPTARSCGRCVRGYLCHECNTAEGLLKTSARAMALAAYMVKIAEREGALENSAVA